MTFSIVAFSPESKQIGLATASCGLFTGTICPIVCPSGRFIGTSQAFVNRTIKTDILQILGLSNTISALDEELRNSDRFFEYRQIGVIGFDGQAYAHTGKETSPVSGHLLGNNFIVLGNMLTNIECLDAMAEEFEKKSGDPLAERLLGALEACQKAGGQKAEGRMLRERAAALLVYEETGACHLNLRVDVDEDAVAALRRNWMAYSVYDQFMVVCEEEPGALVSLEEQDRQVPHAPSIFKDLTP